MSNIINENEGTALLKVLVWTNEGPFSVARCLRSKTMPSRNVQQALLSNLLEEVVFTQPLILSRMLQLKRKGANETTTLSCIAVVGTVVHYLQYLLEVKQENTLVIPIIQGLVGLTSSLLEAHKPTEEPIELTDDLSETLNSQQVACFVFGSLLRLNHYVRQRPNMLSPLWKALCELSELFRVPSELLTEACKALLDYIKEGTATLREYKTFQVKILAFLLARLAIFLSKQHYDDNGTTQNQLMVALCTLTGVGMALPTQQRNLPAEDLKLLQQMSNRAEKCLSSMKVKKRSQIVALVRAKAIDGQGLALSLGKAQLLTKSIADMMAQEATPERAEVLLFICQDLLLNTLPSCHPTMVVHPVSTMSASPVYFVSRALRSVSETLLLCESEVPSFQTDLGRGKLHRLFVSWLLPARKGLQHPMVAEVVVTLLLVHIQILEKVKPASSNGLVLLLIQLLFDARTNTGLRSNIASLLVRLSRSPTDAALEAFQVRLACLEQDLQPKTTKKRKRRKETQKLGPNGLYLVLWVASRFSCISSRPTAPHVSVQPSTTSCGLLLAALRVSWSTSALPDGRLNADDTLLDYFLKLWTGDQQRYSTELDVFGCALFLYARTVLRSVKRGELVNRIVHFVSKIGSDGQLVAHVGQKLLPYEMIRTLGIIGEFLPTDCSLVILESISKIFFEFLSHDFWWARTATMSSLVCFASTLPPVHKGVLPKCVPDHMRTLLQHRLQATLAAGDSTSESFVSRRVTSSMVLLKMATFPVFQLDKLFPTSNSLTLPTGSVVATMQTPTGGTAIVIFPPGPQSIEDIKALKEMSDDDNPNVFALQSVQSIADGTWKLLLHESS